MDQEEFSENTDKKKYPPFTLLDEPIYRVKVATGSRAKEGEAMV